MSPNSHAPQTGAPLVEVAQLKGPVVGVALDYPPGEQIPPHRHDSGQLLYAVSGAMSISTPSGTWVVPPQRAVWVPAFAEHSIRMTGRVEMRTVYVRVKEAERLLDECGVVQVSELLRELVLRIMDLPESYASDSPEARLVKVFFDEIGAAPQMPLCLPTPTDPRLLRITEAFIADPSDGRTLAQWAREAGAGERTVARLFVAETGLTFGQWCQQARLLAALEKLAVGGSVTATALDLGYDSPSAFIAMFRKAMGETPGRYFR